MSVKGFIDNTNSFLGVYYCRTSAAYTRCLVTLFKEITKIFDNKTKKLKKREEKNIKGKEK
jgi:hypothetical protein